MAFYKASLKPKVSGAETGGSSQIYTLTDLKCLTFVGGTMSLGGSGSDENADALHAIRMIVPINVLAGSTLNVPTTIQYQICRRPAGSSNAYAYTSFSSASIRIAEDSEILLGFRYKDLRPIYNEQILNEISANFIVNKPYHKFERHKLTIGLDAVPMYEHCNIEDDTGFGQNTMYDAVIQKFDELASNHSRFLLKRWVTDENIRDATSESDFADRFSGKNYLPMYLYTCTGKVATSIRVPALINNEFPTVVLIGSSHGHEKSATYGMYYLLKMMLEHANDSRAIMWLRTHVNLVCVPAINPHGWDRNLRANANGININRNFASFNWAEYSSTAEGSDGEVIDKTESGQYDAKGDEACDQYETRIVTKILKRFGEAVACIDIHTYGKDTGALRDDEGNLLADNFRAGQINCFRIAPDVQSYEKTQNYQDLLWEYHSQIKPFMDDVYGTNIDCAEYGEYGLAPYRPSLTASSPDVIGVMGFTLEVPCGSTSGFLGDRLYKYSPDIIRLCGEFLANAIISILKWQKGNGLISY